MKTMTATSKLIRSRRHGFTLLELLIAVIIIGILVAIIVPVLSSRANEARHTAALKDLESIASAEEHVAIDTGYFVRLYVLDDTRGGDGIPNNTYTGTTQDRIDGIRDEGIHANAANPLQIFFDTGNYTNSDGTLLGSNVYVRAVQNETTFGWNGPYLNVTKKVGGPAPAGVTPPWSVYNPEIASYGIPLDPWGQPYQFFNRQGRFEENPNSTSPEGQFDNEANVSLVFDRPTVLSTGPNGLPGDGTTNAPYGTGDDLYKQF
ncbi:MAG: prepilin-type N-terminal cleavage/methylation domain-containing protein [Candidatus Sumerlaeaceae bacterium]